MLSRFLSLSLAIGVQMNLEVFESRFWAITSQVSKCPTANKSSVSIMLAIASVHHVFSRAACKSPGLAGVALLSSAAVTVVR